MKRLLAAMLLALVIPASAQFRAPNRDLPRRPSPTPAPVLAPLPDCDYRAMGRAAAELIEPNPAPTPVGYIEPEECRGKVCEARAATLAAADYYARMVADEARWVALDTARRACGF
jgi:hypothetical protein